MKVIVFYIFIIILFGIYKKVNIFESFKDGVFSNLKILLNIFPNLFTIMFAVNIFINSGVFDLFNFLFKNSKLIPELFVQGLLKPMSSSSAILMMTNIYKTYGPESLEAKVSSLMQSSSDTTIYIFALYLSSIKIKKTKYGLIVGLLTDFIIFAFVIICYYIFRI